MQIVSAVDAGLLELMTTAVPAGRRNAAGEKETREVEIRARRDVDETEIPHVAEQLLLWRNVLRRLKYATLPLVCMTHEQCTSTVHCAVYATKDM